MSDILIGLVEEIMEYVEGDFDEIQDKILDYLETLNNDDYDYFMDSGVDIQVEMLKESL